MLHEKLGGRRHGRRNLANLADLQTARRFYRAPILFAGRTKLDGCRDNGVTPKTIFSSAVTLFRGAFGHAAMAQTLLQFLRGGPVKESIPESKFRGLAKFL
jgi:hypothetical protein